MITLSNVSFSDSSQEEIGNSYNNNTYENGSKKGWFVSRKKAIFILAVVCSVILAVGLAVHYLSPERGDLCREQCREQDKFDESKTSKTDAASKTFSSSPPPPPPTDIRLPPHLLPLHYKLKIKPDFYGNDSKDYHFEGNVSIRFRCLILTSLIVLHSLDHEIYETVVEEEDSSSGGGWEVQERSHDQKVEFLNLRLNRPLTAGRNYTLMIRFSGPLKDDMKGIYWSRYKIGNSTKTLVTSQLEPTSARKVMPCFDEPHLKATFDVTIIRKINMTSLSNMALNYSERTEDDWTEDHFNVTPRMSTYLLAFTVCNDFEYVENYTIGGTLFRVWARKELISSAKYALEIGIKVHNFFETYFNVSYPLSKQDMLAVPDFAAGAMENWGLIIYRETALLYDPLVSSTANRKRVAAVIAHELAHQWFGNLVSPSWWDDIWLNEGFASYLEYLGMNSAEPDWNIMDHIVIDDVQYVMVEDGLSSSHPVVMPVLTTDGISATFDSITYSKGASLIRMMRYVLGDNTFRLGLTNYLKGHDYSTATHNSIWSALNKQSKLDGQSVDVANWMDPWIKQTGYPLVSVILSRDHGQTRVSVEQRRFLTDLSGRQVEANGQTWLVPFTYTFARRQNWTNPELRWINNASTTYLVSGEDDIILNNEVNDTSSWIVGNIGQFGYYRVNYDERNWNQLISQLNADHSAIPVKNRAQMLDDAFQIGRSGVLDQIVALRLTEYLKNETEYLPWMSAISNLAYVSRMFEWSPDYGYFQEYMLKRLVPAYERLGWDAVPNDTVNSKLLRSEIVRQTCYYGYERCLETALSLFRNWRTNVTNRTIPSDVKHSVYCSAVERGIRDEWQFMYDRYERTDTTADEKNRILFALSCTKTPWLLSRYINYTFDRLRKQDAPSAFSYISRNPIGRILAWNFFRLNWQLIKDRYGGGIFLLHRIIKAASESFSTELDRKQLIDFESVTSDDMGTGSIVFKQSIEKTDLNIRWRQMNENKIMEWLKKQKDKEL